VISSTVTWGLGVGVDVGVGGMGVAVGTGVSVGVDVGSTVAWGAQPTASTAASSSTTMMFLGVVFDWRFTFPPRN